MGFNIPFASVRKLKRNQTFTFKKPSNQKLTMTKPSNQKLMMTFTNIVVVTSDSSCIITSFVCEFFSENNLRTFYR